jgi:DNA-binding transcriptional MerR regulator
MVKPLDSQPRDPVQWTLEELRVLAEEILAMEGIASESGRIRSIPDERTLRYYTTIGLLSRPAAFRGRTALYHRHHLAQIVTIKRLQASGLSLSDVQIKLTGLTPTEMERLAKLPKQLPNPAISPDKVPKVHEERVPNIEIKDVLLDASPHIGAWLRLESGVALLLPAPFSGTAESLMDLLRSATPLLDELRRQGLIDQNQ